MVRVLDLFCGCGCAAIGYRKSFPDATITGVDIKDMSSSYPFNFIQMDALSLDYDFLAGFDFIHASPPCQAYSKATPRNARENHLRLIPQTRLLIAATGLPYVIENVEGAGAELKPDIRITMGDKRRYFACGFPVPATHIMNTRYSYGLFTGRYLSKSEIGTQWGIPDEYLVLMRRKDIKQGIPPLMIEALMQWYKGGKNGKMS